MKENDSKLFEMGSKNKLVDIIVTLKLMDGGRIEPDTIGSHFLGLLHLIHIESDFIIILYVLCQIWHVLGNFRYVQNLLVCNIRWQGINTRSVQVER